MTDKIKIRIYVGVTHEGGWETPMSGSSVPLTDEAAMDSLWEGVVGADDAQNGYAFYAVDLELPRPVRSAPLPATPVATTEAIRVDSKEAVLRGRKQALAYVLRTCDLSVEDNDALKQILAMDADDDFDANGAPNR